MIMSTRLNLSILPDIYAVCRIPLKASIPDWAMASSFYSVTQTSDEISIVCQSKDVPAGVKAKRNWRMLKVEGPLDFSLTGILASLAVPLADAGISIFTISTFDNDYLMVQDKSISKAITVLKEVGHTVNH
jgi:hypothetical protein